MAGWWYGMPPSTTLDWLTRGRFVSADRDDQTKKDLLWDYTEAVSELDAFHVQFRAVADRLDLTAKLKS